MIGARGAPAALTQVKVETSLALAESTVTQKERCIDCPSDRVGPAQGAVHASGL
jgi:hypothetical protein